jgi:hypothetical protein
MHYLDGLLADRLVQKACVRKYTDVLGRTVRDDNRMCLAGITAAVGDPWGNFSEYSAGVSPETAMRLARYFGNSPRFWLNLQTMYELEVAEAELGERIAAEVAPAAT